jgi:hypothetical protein
MTPAMFSTIPRLFTALAEWCGCLIAILLYPRRRSGPALAGLLAGALVVQGTFLELTGSLPVAFWMPCMAAAVGLMFLLLALCCDIPLRGVAYCTVSAFLLAEFAASLEWQLYCDLARRLNSQSWLLFWFCLLIIYAGVFGFSIWINRRDRAVEDPMEFQRSELILPVFIGCFCFLFSNLSFVTGNTPFSSDSAEEVYNIRTMVDFAGVAILYAYHFQRGRTLAQRETDAIQNTLKKQYDQYCQTRESIDLINRKYHDMKHQIAALRAEPSGEKRAAYLDQMEEELRAYGDRQDTGHPVLDTLLTGKGMQCSARDIPFTCTVDGSLLDFMDVMDLCTVFGNLLDNAMEYEEKVADPSKRMIALSVSEKKQFVLIRCENYCPQAPVFHGGLPVSTKGDRRFHGFGMKSIRYTAEKYGGSMTAEWKDSWFRLTVLLPRQGERIAVP